MNLASDALALTCGGLLGLDRLRGPLLVKETQLANGGVAGYAVEIAEHKRDPYALVEEIVGKLG